MDALCGRHIIGSARFVDTGYKLLRIAINDGKPCGLDLDHDAVALQKDVIVIAQRNIPFDRLVCAERRWVLEASEVAASANFHSDR